jgi:hypothetical protein
MEIHESVFLWFFLESMGQEDSIVWQKNTFPVRLERNITMPIIENWGCDWSLCFAVISLARPEGVLAQSKPCFTGVHSGRLGMSAILYNTSVTSERWLSVGCGIVLRLSLQARLPGLPGVLHWL